MADRNSYYLTTAISYPNDVPHIGHAYEAVATDALARFRRLQGRDVFFLTGTDEHGLKMLKTAKAKGITPAELADRNTPRFREMVRMLDCSNDDFITTREARHTSACAELWRRMEANGDIYLGKYSGWYSVRDEAYYDESELQEGDGKLSPQGTPVEWVEEESYFFKLSAYQEKLLAHYKANPHFIGPETRVYGVIGWPVAQSRGPDIHNAGFAAVGHDGVYLPLPVAPEYEQFKATVGSLLGHDRLRFSGASVTAPHKGNLIRFVTEAGGVVDDLSAAIGAANTLMVDERGRPEAKPARYLGLTLHSEPTLAGPRSPG